MADASPQAHRVQSADDRPAKKRKLRRGTQSCWECKRRKTRCTFAPPVSSVCDGCKARGTSCVGQEFADEPPPSTHMGDRLGRIEALVDQLARKADSTPHESSGDSLISDAQEHGQDPEYNHHPVCDGLHTTKLPCLLHNETSRELFAAWPNQNDLDIVLSLPLGVSDIFHGVICTSYSMFLCQDVPSLRDILQLPTSDAHPVLIARKLLLLGTLLQGISPCYYKDLSGLSESVHNIMVRVIETVIKLVTSNGELVQSIEGIECIMMESMYHNNAGNLRRGWLATRRAMVIAQMMRIDRGDDSAPPTVLEDETLTRVTPSHTWFCLVHLDRYLSLMLGLPQGCLDNTYATPEALEQCSPTERMGRIHSVVAGRILQRNLSELPELSTTQEIDRMLQSASAAMPAQWWLNPKSASAGDDSASIKETYRLMDQFTHYHLLTQLHLPYILSSSADRKYDYSKVTAVNASRELLARFVSFSSIDPVASYCRGIDFLVFISSTVLILAYLEAHCHSQSNKEQSLFAFLVHQRLSDRGMIECALENLQQMAINNTGFIPMKVVGLLKPLLDIEADAANGGTYTTNSSSQGGGELECSGELSHSGKVLKVYIPYSGTINIEHRIESVPDSSGKDAENHLGVDASDWNLDGADMVIFDNLVYGESVPDDAWHCPQTR